MKTARTAKTSKTTRTQKKSQAQAQTAKQSHAPLGGSLGQGLLDQIADLVAQNYLLDDFDGVLELLKRHRLSAQITLFHTGRIVESKSFSTFDIFPVGPETYPGQGIYGLVVYLLGPTAGPYRTWWGYPPSFFVQTPCAHRLLAESDARNGVAG